MISKRNRRPGNPQENLRQFALNNSKGVDSTKSPTDVNTICSSNNLIVNPDGSLSLRKPIEYVADTEDSIDNRQYYLYDGISRLKIAKNTVGNVTTYAMSILQKDIEGNVVAQPVRLDYYDYKGIRKTVNCGTVVQNLIIPKGSAEVLNLNSATILGNCEVDAAELTDLVDATLYDTVGLLPRYVQLHYAEDDEVWVFDVKTPEPNTLTTAEGEIPLNPNMTLDSATSLRDSYGAIVPTIKGILAYVPSKIVNNKVVANPSAIYPDSLADTCSVGTVFAGNEATGTFEMPNATFTYTVQYAKTATPGAQLDIPRGICRVNISLDSDLTGVAYIIEYNISHQTKPLIGVASTRHTEIISESYAYDDLTSTNGVSVESEYVFENTFGDSLMLGAYVYFRVVRYKLTLDEISVRIKDITEPVKSTCYRIANAFEKNTIPRGVLKAFCNLPTEEGYYAAWFKSTDGVNWTELDTYSRTDGRLVRELNPAWKPPQYSVEDSEKVPAENDYVSRTYYPLEANSNDDIAFSIHSTASSPDFPFSNSRIDAVNISNFKSFYEEGMYRFKIIKTEPITNSDTEYDSTTGSTETQYRVYATVAQQDYTPVFKDDYEFFEVEYGNAVYGKKLYHKKAIYSYGSEKFFNNIFVSDIDSFITPLYNIIDLDANSASQATCIVPWRDYLVSATSNAIYLHTKAQDGFLTKTVNTSVGISEEDSRCCKAVLNGILFKSGPKVYQMYPNMYSGDDSTLNLTEISRPVEEYLEAYEAGEYTPFAMSTDSEYILMLPNTEDTTCLRYDYSSKLWTVCTYSIIVTDYHIINLNDIRIFGIYDNQWAEYKFDATTSGTVYGDKLIGDTKDSRTPINFEWDTGQKTDNISLAKQFVESKLVFATEDTLEYFPMTLEVHVDGDPHVTTLDVNSDAPFWKEGSSIGVANTLFRLGADSDTGVFRQLIVRYSGKGRSVRHILSGSPTSNFRLYETYVRYKSLNIKR